MTKLSELEAKVIESLVARRIGKSRPAWSLSPKFEISEAFTSYSRIAHRLGRCLQRCSCLATVDDFSECAVREAAVPQRHPLEAEQQWLRLLPGSTIQSILIRYLQGDAEIPHMASMPDEEGETSDTPLHSTLLAET